MRSVEEIADVVRSALTMATVWGVSVLFVFVALRSYMPLLFTQNEEVALLASQIIVLYAAFQISDALQCIMVGILRGLQQVKSIAIVAFIAYIVINIPVGYFVAFKLEMGAAGLIVGYIVGVTTAALLYGVQVRRYMRYLRKIS